MIKKLRLMLSTSTVALTGLLLISMSAPALALTDCSHVKGCERKFCEIETQLEIAQKNNDKSRTKGLKKALKEARTYCTDKNLRQDLDKDIQDAKAEIAEYEADLEEAKEDGKADKVRKYRGKIKEENDRLKHFETERSELE